MWARAYGLGARINSNSWGTDSHGQYLSFERDADRITYENKDYVLVVAAGNAGPHSRSLGSPAGAKNAISVGAVMTEQADRSAWFSSRGPTMDGRLKPDLVAPGAPVHSAQAGTVDGYQPLQGTSMATPQVSGAAALVRAAYRAGHGGGASLAPSAALIKALLINGAVEIKGSHSDPLSERRFPNNIQGWGRVDVSRSLSLPDSHWATSVWDVASAPATSQHWSTVYEVSDPGEHMKVTLVWTDPPAAPGARMALVNDLDLRVTAPDGRVFLGNHFTGQSPGYSVPGGQADQVNTVEGVHLWAGRSFAGELPPGAYKVEVIGQNVPMPGSNFAVVIGRSHAGADDGNGGAPLPPPEPGPPPVLRSGDADGTRLTLTYDRTLDRFSVPVPADFHVAAGAEAHVVSRVGVAGVRVQLVLDRPITENARVILTYKPGAHPIASEDGVAAAAIDEQWITNRSVAPVLTGAAADGTTLTLSYSEALDPASVPAPADFTVDGAAAGNLVVRSVALDGGQVVLQLISPAPLGSSLTVDYRPGANPLRDRSGNLAAALFRHPVISDASPPQLQSAEVNGDELLLQYDEPLDPQAVPLPTAFRVAVGDQRPEFPVAVTLSESTVRLRLQIPVEPGRLVLASYVPGRGALQDRKGNPAPAFAGVVAANRSQAAALLSGMVNGATVSLGYSEPLHPGAGFAADFTVLANGQAVPVHRLAISGSVLNLTLGRTVGEGEEVAVSYRPGRWPVRDARGNEVAPFEGHLLANQTTSPQFMAARLDGVLLSLRYDRQLDRQYPPGPADFQMRAEGRLLPQAERVLVFGDEVRLYLRVAAPSGQAVTVDYQPGRSPLRDAAGNPAGPLRGITVTNVTAAPALQTAVLQGQTVLLTFSEPLDPGGVPAATDFTLLINGRWAGFPARVVVTGNQVILYLLRAPGPGQVKVSYARRHRPLRDLSGAPVESISDADVIA